MPRPKTPDGHRIPVTIKLSEPEAAEIDAARGDTERIPWMREAILAAARGAAGNGNPGVPETGNRSPGKTPDRGGPRETAKPCKHRNMRMSKGICPDCQTWVVKP